MLFSNGFYDTAIHGDDIPAGAVCITDAEYAALLAGQAAGKIILTDANGRPVLVDPPEPSPDQIWASYSVAVQDRLDAFAQSRGYDSGVSCASYAASTNATFKAEAGRFVELRDQTWAKCYTIVDEVKAGKRPMPTLDELLLELPVLSWDANV